MSASDVRQFIDTNLLVYAHDASSGVKHHQAEALVAQLWQTRRGCLSVQVFQEFYVTVTRKIPQPLSAEKAASILTQYQAWVVHTPTPKDVLKAIEIQTGNQLSFWDAMSVQSASVLGCDVLWTEDLNHNQLIEGVTVRNPFMIAGW